MFLGGEREEYAAMMLSNETAYGRVIFFNLDEWQEMEPQIVDPHLAFGVTTPDLIGGELFVFCCVDRLIGWVDGQTDDVFQQWLEYWIMHLSLHVIEQALTDASRSDIEMFVDQKMRDVAPTMFGFGEVVKGSRP